MKTLVCITTNVGSFPSVGAELNTDYALYLVCDDEALIIRVLKLQTCFQALLLGGIGGDKSQVN